MQKGCDVSDIVREREGFDAYREQEFAFFLFFAGPGRRHVPTSTTQPTTAKAEFVETVRTDLFGSAQEC